MDLSLVLAGMFTNSSKASVTSGYTFHHMLFSSIPIHVNDDTLSQPVKAWKNGSAADFLGPMDAAMM